MALLELARNLFDPDGMGSLRTGQEAPRSVGFSSTTVMIRRMPCPCHASVVHAAGHEHALDRSRITRGTALTFVYGDTDLLNPEAARSAEPTCLSWSASR